VWRSRRWRKLLLAKVGRRRLISDPSLRGQ
jgi:hypothetical protein